MQDASQPRHWYTTNLVGVPAPVLASTVFNAHPVALSIAGVRPAHAGLFALLARCGPLEEAADVFTHYLGMAYGLRKPTPDELVHLDRHEGRRWRSSWRKLLQGWGMDANGPAGAVLKGWVESRFGLVPTFHKAPLGRFPSPAWMGYLEEKSASRYHNNNIHQQLDLLWEFCQWALARYAPWAPWAGQALTPPEATAPRHLRLWRGSTRCEEQCVAGSLRERRCTLRLNNLVSFSVSREAASVFGDWVFEAQVPVSKLLLVPGLLPGQILQGEQEVLALGGDYELEAAYV